MTGKAHPNLISALESREGDLNASSLADSSAKQTVNEVIWQQLFSKDGVIGKQIEKVRSCLVHNEFQWANFILQSQFVLAKSDVT